MAEETEDMVSELDSVEESAGYAKEHASRTTDKWSDNRSQWCFDSGATSMSTGNRELFEFLDNRHRGKLGIASGTSMPIKGRGIVRFKLPNGMVVRLGNVIYVPGLAENLLSLEALHLAGYETQGSKRGYEIRKDGKIVARGKREGKTTYLDSVVSRDALKLGPSIGKMRHYASMAMETHSTLDRKRELIHRRLGHPGRKRFNDCVHDMGLDELKLPKADPELEDKCEICVKSRQVKGQSHKKVPRAKKPLARVYMDFWGPNRDSVGDERYYISLIDDYSRFSWLYVMIDRKAETVMRTLDLWIRRVERQSGRTLLVIRTDNAREFRALIPEMDKRGIEMEFIEAETPPQNGVAERFNRYVLEITRALLIDSQINKRYWKYAVVTANYLRNKTTLVKGSADINDDEDGARDKTPYELWYGHQPDLSCLRTWGCRVLYYHKPDSKLEPRVEEGTFLMYGKSTKQYYVLPKGGSELKLVTSPVFWERHRGHVADMGKLRQAPIEEISQTLPTSVWGYTGGGIRTRDADGNVIVTGAGGPTATADITRENASKRFSNQGEIGGGAQDKHQGGAPPRDTHLGRELPKDGNLGEMSPETNHRGEESPNDKPQGEESPTPRVYPVEVNIEDQQPAKPAEAMEPTGQSAEPQPEPEPVRRSERQRQVSQAFTEHQATEQIYGRKRKAEGEQDMDVERPAQRLRAHLARLAVASELMLSDWEHELANKAAEKAGIQIPKTYAQAINDPIYGTKWKEAIHQELTNLIQFNTWKLIPRKQANGTISSCRWVFDVKIGIDGRVERFKARLVARGNEQSEDDFDDTFAPVFRLDSLRILVAIMVKHRMKAHLLDAINAFAGSDLDKPNCMTIPEGLQDFDPEMNKDLVLELQKSIYGLRQSANLWNRKITKFLVKIGFKTSTADPSIFTNSRGIIIALYVDDILVIGKELAEIEAIKEKLKKFHPMRDMGQVEKLLGIRFTWKKDSIQLDQGTYAKQILEEFGMADCKPVMMPISPSMQLDDLDNKHRLKYKDHKLFRRIIGRLMFLTIGTRADIAFAVNRLSQYLAEPYDVHLTAAKHILRYIKGTLGYTIRSSAKGRDRLTGYADSAYANSTQKRSTSGLIFMLNGMPISWSSRKQSITAQSTTEAEYMALAEATKQAVWIRHFLHSIGKSQYNAGPTMICEDNMGALKLADNPVYHPKTKHIAVRFHVIRDHIASGEIKLQYTPTDQMIADGLTKATNKEIHRRFVEAIGMVR